MRDYPMVLLRVCPICNYREINTWYPMPEIHSPADVGEWDLVSELCECGDHMKNQLIICDYVHILEDL